jgi:hypothetical protein
MERGGERRQGRQWGDAREAGDGCGEADLMGRGVGRRRRRSNPNPDPGAMMSRDGFFSYSSSILSYQFSISKRQFIYILLFAGFKLMSSYISR